MVSAGKSVISILISLFILPTVSGQVMDHWAFDSLHIPFLGVNNELSDPVIVAIVDDGFNLSHQAIRDFIYKDPVEVEGNQLDDDGNGFADDISGWDISDMDNDVSVPEGKEDIYYHGTYIASLVSQVARLAYGERATERVRILPIKVLSDEAGKTYLKDGYRGIEYAIKAGADIICCAWSGGIAGEEEKAIIRNAIKQGILVVASAGNFNSEEIVDPAALPGVLTVAGLDSLLRKEAYSNYGMRVDISVPSSNIPGAHPDKENAFIRESGTSAATALTSGCAAVLMAESGRRDSEVIIQAILNSSTPFSKEIKGYGGKMGSGILNLHVALEYMNSDLMENSYFSSLRSKGTIFAGRATTHHLWKVSPPGGYHGFYLDMDASEIHQPARHRVDISVGDTLWNSYMLDHLPERLFVPAPEFQIQLIAGRIRKKDFFQVGYQGKTIDSTTIFCSGTRWVEQEEGSLEDGSGENTYANKSSCRWIIEVPAGKKITFRFQEMDTEANVDYVYLFDGKSALMENVIAQFSGSNIPPVVTSRTNQVLVWFVTDADRAGQGWKFHYNAVEEVPEYSIKMLQKQ